MKLAVVGLGLIGGSVALAARERLGADVVGADVREVVSSDAARSVVSRTVDAGDTVALEAALGDADITILAAPVRAIEQMLGHALEHSRVVTDTGSTKRAVARTARRSPHASRFVGSHPMAGTPEGGLDSARADLFEQRPWIVCAEGSEPSHVAAVEELARSLGAEPRRMTPDEHDRAVAVTSHVPQLLASALAVLGEERGATGAGGPAFERMTRGAGGAARMWHDILDTNSDEIARVLRELIAVLGPAAEGLGADPPALDRSLEVLAAARKLRER